MTNIKQITRTKIPKQGEIKRHINSRLYWINQIAFDLV